MIPLSRKRPLEVLQRVVMASTRFTTLGADEAVEDTRVKDEEDSGAVAAVVLEVTSVVAEVDVAAETSVEVVAVSVVLLAVSPRRSRPSHRKNKTVLRTCVPLVVSCIHAEQLTKS
jgi:hypothetical protein